MRHNRQSRVENNLSAECGSLENYLTTMRDFRRQQNSKFVHSCFEDFVLAYGELHAEKMPRPKWVKKGIIKQWYNNCLKALFDNPDKLTYCEGFAMGIIPVCHAWLLHQGKVIDPTWSNGTEYFGVAFRSDYVFRIAAETGYAGVLDNWHQGFPLLAGEHSSKDFLQRSRFCCHTKKG